MIHLILHKVRGSPAFDIAERCGMCKEPCQPQCGLWPGCQNKEWWIIPTSGHTAHPCQWWQLDTLIQTQEWTLPAGLPDHYSAESESAAPKGKGQKLDIVAIIRASLPKIKRRV